MPEKIAFHPSLLQSHCIIDVRTPLEFDEDHLPGACNVPILTNEERVEIGTIHKHLGGQPARIRALELTCGRFAAMTEEAARHAAGRPILAYCWRGGLRSHSMALLLENCGYPVVQLHGGYKAFRNYVSSYFDDFVPPAPLLVLHGMTGCGKTTFINGLDHTFWFAIDLEGLASHRGSAFGSLGLNRQPAQKRFDTMLWNALREAPSDRPVVLEGESRRIGEITLPGRLYDVMAQSCKIWCSASLETRVTRVVAEYARPEYRDAMTAALERIKKKLGGSHYSELKRMLDLWDMQGVTHGLIEHYYDKLYYKHRAWTPDAEISLESYRQGEEELRHFWLSRTGGVLNGC